MRRGRVLEWDGCCNVRDLGGLQLEGGGVTRRGAVVRSDSPERLSERGWAALRDYGIRTIIDLRNFDELQATPRARPVGVGSIHLPLDGIDDTEFWSDWASGPQFGTPLYFGPHLEHFPDRSARVLTAIANAPRGGVLIHCVGGRDRTGQIAMLVLGLCGVEPDEIADDYALSATSIRRRSAALGLDDDVEETERFLRASGKSVRELIISTLVSLDLRALIRRGGASERDLDRLRARLVG